MNQGETLADVFLAHARVRVGAADNSELERLLDSACGKARARWPEVAVSPGLFIRHIAERLPNRFEGQPVARILESLHLAELYLARACADGNPAALRVLENDYLAKLSGRLRRQGWPLAIIEDVCQDVRKKLLVGTEDGSAPHIAAYSGDGELVNWMSVIASRSAAKRHQRDRVGSGEGDEELLNKLPEGKPLEADFIKSELHEKFRAAVREATSRLSDEQRHLLKLYYGDGLSTPKLARLLNTNQPAIWRRLKSAREEIRAETQRLVQEHLGLDKQAFESFILGLESRLDVSLSQVFERRDVEPDEGGATSGP